MSERPSLLASELDEINLAVTDMPAAELRAKVLETQAKNERENAATRRTKAFAEASARLMELIRGGDLSPSEIVREVAILDDYNPRRRHWSEERTSDATIAAFESLQPGVPFIGLIDRDERNSVIGIVTDAPREIQVKPYVPAKDNTSGVRVHEPSMTPHAYIKVPVRKITNERKVNKGVSTELLELHRVTIGYQAIKNLVESAEFTRKWHEDHSCHGGSYLVTNEFQLERLLNNIELLHILGMEKIDTRPVHNAILQSKNSSTYRRRINNIKRNSTYTRNQRNRQRMR